MEAYFSTSYYLDIVLFPPIQQTCILATTYLPPLLKTIEGRVPNYIAII